MHPFVSFPLTLVVATCLSVAVSFGGIGRQQHPWGRFQPGAWKLVQVVTESFEKDGSIRSVTQTKTTLSEISDRDVTLLVQASVEVAGKQFDAEPQKVLQGFLADSVDEDAKITDLGPAEVTIQGRRIPCTVQQIESKAGANKKVAKIYTSASVAPYVLKRESKTIAPDGKVVSETTVDVIALDVPCNVHDRIGTAAHLKAVHKNSKGTTTTLAVTSTDVPGGIISHSLKELDNSGRMVRRSWLQTIDYGVQPDDGDRGGFFHRRRARGARRARRY